MKLVCMSDTHLMHRRYPIEVPDGDILIHSGDGMNEGRITELHPLMDWLKTFKHKHRIYVAGNHDWAFQKEPALVKDMLPEGWIYLQDSMVEIEGFRIWGSPWQPEFCNWAFNLPRGHRLREKWNLIPRDIDVLITHGPPRDYGDLSMHGEHVGCKDLKDIVLRVKPKVHIFGHVHGGYGCYRNNSTLFVNAAICDEVYRPFNAPIVVELTPDGAHPFGIRKNRKGPAPLSGSTPSLW